LGQSGEQLDFLAKTLCLPAIFNLYPRLPSAQYDCTLKGGIVMEASMLDLRKKMKDVMSAIERHERVILTHRGRQRAVITPLDEAAKPTVKVADLPAFGMWAKRSEMSDAVAFVKKLRDPRGCFQGGRVMRNILLVITALLAGTPLFAGGRQVYRNAHGRQVGSVETSDNRSVYRDAHGRQLGSSTQQGNRTIYHDAQGRSAVTATQQGNRTIYRDAHGRQLGSSTQQGKRTIYRDAQGRSQGSKR
jgi:antitoxin (DNA-binding transcriptional repressor) of toxin-antitoxin stability system